MSRPIKKATIIIFVILFSIFAGSRLLLRFYEVDLVHTIVLNAVIQKAPQGYSRQEISQVFAVARRRAEQDNREEAYLEKLFSFSRRLEKIQLLSRAELEELLDELREAGALRPEIPNPKSQIPNKLQIPNSKPDPEPGTIGSLC